MSEPTIYKHDLFVSYSEADRHWVQNELLPRLRDAGLRVIDQSDFVIGAPKLINAEQAVDNSRHTLIVITPAWLDSEWARSDWLLTSSKDPNAHQRRLIPLRLLPCQLPTSIDMLTVVDFTNPTTYEDAMKHLLRDLVAPSETLANEQPIQRSSLPTSSSYRVPQSSVVGSALQNTEPTSTNHAGVLDKPILIMLVTNLITTIVSLMSNVVAGYLTPTFEAKRWLAIGIFVFLSLITFWIGLAQFSPAFSFASLKMLHRFTYKTLQAALVQSIQTRPKPLSFMLVLSVPLASIVWLFSPTVDKLWAQRAPLSTRSYLCFSR